MSTHAPPPMRRSSAFIATIFVMFVAATAVLCAIRWGKHIGFVMADYADERYYHTAVIDDVRPFVDTGDFRISLAGCGFSIDSKSISECRILPRCRGVELRLGDGTVVSYLAPTEARPSDFEEQYRTAYTVTPSSFSWTMTSAEVSTLVESLDIKAVLCSRSVRSICVVKNGSINVVVLQRSAMSEILWNDNMRNVAGTIIVRHSVGDYSRRDAIVSSLTAGDSQSAINVCNDIRQFEHECRRRHIHTERVE